MIIYNGKYIYLFLLFYLSDMLPLSFQEPFAELFGIVLNLIAIKSKDNKNAFPIFTT